MTLAELMSAKPAERWRTVPPEQQEMIGALVVQWIFGELVADDDGTETSAADREVARAQANDAHGSIAAVVQDAFPYVIWAWPHRTRYFVSRHP